MTAVNLSSRIPFVNLDDGTLTPEAYRFLSDILNRTGGILGNSGVDVFGDLTGAGSMDSSITDTVTQPVAVDSVPDMISQPLSVDVFAPDVVQPAITLPAYVSGGAAPAGGTGATAGAYDTAANRDAAITLLNNIRTALIAHGIMS